MKIPQIRDNCKYSINLKIFKLQPSANSDKKSSLVVPMPPIMPSLQKKRNSWRNAWKMANHNNTQSFKNRNHNKNSYSYMNAKDKLNKEIVINSDQTTVILKDQVQNNNENNNGSEKFKKINNNSDLNNNENLSLEEDQILCK